MRSRYGIKPTEAQWARALLDILEGWSTLHGVSGEGIERHTVAIAGKVVPVAYSPEGAIILTVLPWRALGQRDWHPPKRK